MNKIDKKVIIRNLEQVPQVQGIFRFHSGSDLLYLSRSSNLRRTISRLFTSKPEDERILEMISRTEYVSWKEENSLLQALLSEKLELNEMAPEYNSYLKKGMNYSYLKIDFFKVPFFGISEDTAGPEYFMGPFPDRFMVLDAIDLMADQFKYPACSGKEYPCERYSKKACSGWCLKERSEIAGPITRNYLMINNTLIDSLKKKRQDYFNELEFNLEAVIKDQILLLKKFQDMIKFFHVIKKLDLQVELPEAKVQINKGQIASCEFNGSEHYFPIHTPDYRDNEYLAIDKQQLGESLIIYNHLKKIYSQKIEELYLESTRSLLNGLEITDKG